MRRSDRRKIHPVEVTLFPLFAGPFAAEDAERWQAGRRAWRDVEFCLALGTRTEADREAHAGLLMDLEYLDEAATLTRAGKRVEIRAVGEPRDARKVARIIAALAREEIDLRYQAEIL